MATAIACATHGREPVRRAERHRGEGRHQRPPRPARRRGQAARRDRRHLRGERRRPDPRAPGDGDAGGLRRVLRLLPAHARARRALTRMRVACRDRTHNATTVGYGPRFLHSTGQLHKGGPNTGVFLQLTADAPSICRSPARATPSPPCATRRRWAICRCSSAAAGAPSASTWARTSTPGSRRSRRDRRRPQGRAPRGNPPSPSSPCSKQPVVTAGDAQPAARGAGGRTHARAGAMVIFGASGDLHAAQAPSRALQPDARSAAAGAVRRSSASRAARVATTPSATRCATPATSSRAAVRSTPRCWSTFARDIFYQQGEYDDPGGLPALKTAPRARSNATLGLPGNRVFYLATPPSSFAPSSRSLGQAGWRRPPPATAAAGAAPFTRVIIEKPFGHDLDDARAR